MALRARLGWEDWATVTGVKASALQCDERLEVGLVNSETTKTVPGPVQVDKAKRVGPRAYLLQYGEMFLGRETSRFCLKPFCLNALQYASGGKRIPSSY